MTSEKKIDDVWDKGEKIRGRDPDTHRQDPCGRTMSRDEYGRTDTSQGWEIDHIDPNGGDGLSNLQPLHYKTNRSKGDGSLDCGCG